VVGTGIRFLLVSPLLEELKPTTDEDTSHVWVPFACHIQIETRMSNEKENAVTGFNMVHEPH
jgi:hypothetical protein